MYTPFSQRPTRITVPVASALSVWFFSSPWMAMLTMPTMPANAPAASTAMTASAIRAAMYPLTWIAVLPYGGPDRYGKYTHLEIFGLVRRVTAAATAP